MFTPAGHFADLVGFNPAPALLAVFRVNEIQIW